jgi:hypothetical protein
MQTMITTTDRVPDLAASPWSDAEPRAQPTAGASVRSRPNEPDVVPLEATAASFTIVRAFGETRKAAEAYLEAHHYMRSSGGSSQMFAVMDTNA